MARLDPHSYCDNAQPEIVSMEWHADVDFAAQRLSAEVEDFYMGCANQVGEDNRDSAHGLPPLSRVLARYRPPAKPSNGTCRTFTLFETRWIWSVSPRLWREFIVPGEFLFSAATWQSVQRRTDTMARGCFRRGAKLHRGLGQPAQRLTENTRVGALEIRRTLHGLKDRPGKGE